MSRRLATFVGIRSIPIAVVLVVAVACSSPKREIGSDASIAKEPAASTPSATAKPSSPAVAPAAVASAQATDNAPTPAETPLPSVSQPAARTSEPKSPPSDPLKEVQESEARRVEYQRGLVQLAADLEAAKALVAQSQRDLLAFKNPYLARPNLSPDEATAIQGLNGAERVKWAETRVADAVANVSSAQAAYDDAKANPPIN